MNYLVTTILKPRRYSSLSIIANDINDLDDKLKQISNGYDLSLEDAKLLYESIGKHIKKLTIKDFPIGTKVIVKSSSYLPEYKTGIVVNHRKPNARSGFIHIKFDTPDNDGLIGTWTFTVNLIIEK